MHSIKLPNSIKLQKVQYLEVFYCQIFNQYVQMNYKSSYFQGKGLVTTEFFKHFKLLTDKLRKYSYVSFQGKLLGQEFVLLKNKKTKPAL